jgi:hypothetical protein
MTAFKVMIADLYVAAAALVGTKKLLKIASSRNY